MAASATPVILAIDDDPGILDSFALILEPEHEVVDAPDGAAAMRMLTSRSVDLILLDLLLPDIGGLVLLKQIRALAPKIPVIVVSAVGDASSVVHALTVGADDYVTKPFAEEELRLRARGLLAAAMLRSPRVLVIEPHVGLRAAISAAIERECVVTAVASAALAVPEFGAWTPDVLVIGRAPDADDPAGPIQALLRRWPGLPILSAGGEFYALLGGIAAHLPWAPDLPSVRRVGRRVAALMRRIADSYATILVEELAAVVGLSTRQVSREFHEELGMTAKDFIMRVRVHAALALVRETREKLDVIADLVGLHDAPHLCHTFRRHGLRPPSRYRS